MESQLDSSAGSSTSASQVSLKRAITHWDAFFIAAGVPALVIFSIGSIAATVGTPSILIWIVSVIIGILMGFVYAEMAGMFPHKSGGPPIFGAEAWKSYHRLIPPLDIWGYWFAWSPVLAIGALLAGNYVQAEWFPGAQPIVFGPFQLSFAYAVGAGILLAFFGINHFGVKESAITQTVLAVCSLVPLAAISIVPFFQGSVNFNNFVPFVPLSGDWFSWNTFVLISSGLFVAAWSAYAFETAVCYTAEFKNPDKDTPRAIFYSGGLCLFFYTLVPITLLGVLGVETIARDPSVALAPLANQIFGPIGGPIMIAMLLVALLLSINTAMLGSSRTLYQASLDGYTFRFFQKTNKHKAPDRAMIFDVVVNLFLMLLNTPIAILAASTVGYMINNCLDLVAGYLLRRDKPQARRPWKAPGGFIKIGLGLAGFNFIFLVFGSYSWGWDALIIGLAIVLSAIPIYYYRKYVEDRREPVIAVEPALE